MGAMSRRDEARQTYLTLSRADQRRAPSLQLVATALGVTRQRAYQLLTDYGRDETWRALLDGARKQATLWRVIDKRERRANRSTERVETLIARNVERVRQLTEYLMTAPEGHGKMSTYFLRRCRCDWCRASTRKSACERRLRRLRGEPPLPPGNPAFRAQRAVPSTQNGSVSADAGGR